MNEDHPKSEADPPAVGPVSGQQPEAGPESADWDAQRWARVERVVAVTQASGGDQRTWRDRLGGFLLERPLLHLLVVSPWLTVACLVILVFGAVGVAGLFKVWVTTPPWFRPAIRVSALDLGQAWMLRRSAEKLEQAGDTEGASKAWMEAAAQNLGDIELVRGALRHLAQAKDADRRDAVPALSQTEWLLRLGRTNESDVRLAVQIYRKYDRWHELYEFLHPRADRLDDAEERSYIGALFWTGRMAEFGRAWERSKLPLIQNKELRLCRLAHLAGWGTPGEAGEAREELEIAREGRSLPNLAHRVSLVMYTALLDPSGYLESLERLQSMRADRLSDHVGYWRLLDNLGHRDEARQLAQVYALPPVTPWEAIELAAVYEDLGLLDHAIRFLARYAPQFGNWPVGGAVGLWVRYSSVLVKQRRWEDLLTMILEVRRYPATRIALGGYAPFLEGRAQQALNHPEIAAACFEEAARLPFRPAELGLQAGVSMLQLGYPDLAQKVLGPLESDLGEDYRYWQAIVETTFIRREDAVDLLKAARHACRLLPDETLSLNNYAAALLINRWLPEEAVEITLRLLARQPDSIEARINHSFALAQGRRFAEARDCLAAVVPSQLTEPNRTAYHLAAFEIYAGLREFAEARTHQAAIDPARLFPSQRKWLETEMRKLSPAGENDLDNSSRPVVSH